MKLHARDIRLYVNGGISMPVCYASQRGPLDLERTGLPTAGEGEQVTCKHCLRTWSKRYPWAGPLESGR